jgi:hypothetical protein
LGPRTSAPAPDDSVNGGLSEEEQKEIAKQVIGHIAQHAQAHGNFSGFSDFLEQCDRIVEQTRKSRGSLPITLANSLARDVSSIRESTAELPVEFSALVFRGIAAGFLFANLKREIDAAVRRRPAGKKAGKPKRKTSGTAGR